MDTVVILKVGPAVLENTRGGGAKSLHPTAGRVRQYYYGAQIRTTHRVSIHVHKVPKITFKSSQILVNMDILSSAPFQ